MLYCYGHQYTPYLQSLVKVIMLTSGHILQNRYCIEHLLGRGGFGTVYCARHIRLKKLVALKETFHIDADSLHMFAREAEVFASLEHSALPSVSDYFDEGGYYYIVMDYIPGENLAEYLDHQPKHRLKESEALELFTPVLDALDYMHSRTDPVIHRDIKPSNIRITPERKVYLVDFGLAKVYTAQSHSPSTLIAATPGFSPPEQYRQRADTRSDLYSVGATLYMMLSGTEPAEALDRMAGVALLPLRTLNPDISPALAEVITRLLEMRPDDRYPDVAAVQQALKDTLVTRHQTSPDTISRMHRGSASSRRSKDNPTIASYDKAIASNPNHADAYLKRGLAYADKGTYAQAVADYTRAIALDPQNDNAYFSRGFAYYKQGEYERAIADYTWAIVLNPQDAASYYNRGLAYDEIGDYDHAIADYTRAIALNPHDTDAYNNRGLAYEGKGDYDRAIADYDAVIARDPANITAIENRKIALSRRQRT